MTDVQQLPNEQLELQVTAYLAVPVPPHASDSQVQSAYARALLSKDDAIGNLAWSHTREALGEDVRTVLNSPFTTQRLAPEAPKPPNWPAVVFPTLAGLVIVGSLLLLRTRCWQRRARPTELELSGLNANAHSNLAVPSELARHSVSFLGAGLVPLIEGLRRSSWVSSAGSAHCNDDVEGGPRVHVEGVDAPRERKRCNERDTKPGG